MSSLFSSPSKQASSAASAEQGISQQDIAQAENYVNTQEGQLRSAIPSGASNPYLNAASSVSPSTYKVDPANTVAFGNSAPQYTGANAFATPQSGTAVGATTTPQMTTLPSSSQNPFVGTPRAIQPIARTNGPTTQT
jgi:hypothetical protein